MKSIEERLRGIIAGEPLPENMHREAIVEVPAVWLMEAVGEIERSRPENRGCKYLPSNLWY
jgi:hypothetical protein